MDVNGPTRFRPRKSTSSDRFLGAFPHAPLENPSSSSSTATTANVIVELNEDDVFWTGDYAEQDHHHHQNHIHSTPPSSASSTPRHNHNPHHHHKSFAQAENFGILAVLPENESSPGLRNVSNLYHKASFSSSSSSSSSSSRMIPAIPKPPLERLALPPSLKYQSAPVNVPVLASAMRSHHEFDDIDDDDDGGGDGEMLPPHEIVARAQSPMLACSVLEGAGRTLKGRDLRQVRNAVWRRTGFLD
ncbi:protein S40-7-like [Corylus avellana]|uniref:protein S40-7-like n=1 Tax=Corylus avellana TaxID=13451 RepID=UPI00286A9C2A|nr:protein S40-7-like [Corylus avellana]XP_059429698.1 protein S40-7-like [Corylus avellana]XP_059429699.1 protein S40-7-like [Corylus avellana]